MNKLPATAYRMYTFTNFYMNSISQGIQPFHVLGEMTIKYVFENNIKLQIKKHGELPKGYASACSVFKEWVTGHKTEISLNGGPHSGIVAIFDQLRRLGPELGLPIAAFFEEVGALAPVEAMTSCGIVVPNCLYDAKLGCELDRKGDLLEPDNYYFFESSKQPLLQPTRNFCEFDPEYELIKLIKSCPLAR